MCQNGQPTTPKSSASRSTVINRDDSLAYPSQPLPGNTSRKSSLHPTHKPYRLAASYISRTLKKHNTAAPTIGVICGSGLSGLSAALDASKAIAIPYSDVPGFPAVTVAGHAGELIVGSLHGNSVICFRGRFHGYEGHDMSTVALPVRTMRCLGVELVILTNAAGGLHEDYDVGDVAVVRDHIALPLLAGANPLVGPNDEELGPRFPPTSNLYDEKLQSLVVEAADRAGMSPCSVHADGTYAYVSGPNYESKSECRMLKLLGADLVGMSTVPEVVAAHHAGMAVLCLSLVTNKVVLYDDPSGLAEHASHEEVLAAVAGRSAQLVQLVSEVVKRAGGEYLPQRERLPPIRLDFAGREEQEAQASSVLRRDGSVNIWPMIVRMQQLQTTS